MHFHMQQKNMTQGNCTEFTRLFPQVLATNQEIQGKLYG